MMYIEILIANKNVFIIELLKSIYIMDKQTCSFLLVVILVLMIIYYTSSRSSATEAFNIKPYNTSLDAIEKIFHPVHWENEDKTFYVSAGKIAPFQFLSMTRGYGRKLLHGSAVYADKIHFVQDKHRPNQYHIEVFDGIHLAPYKVVLPGQGDIKEGFEAAYQFDLKMDPVYNQYDYIPQEGGRPRDTWDEKWPYHGKIMDSPAFTSKPPVEIPRRTHLPSELELSTTGVSASFTIHLEPDGTIGVYLEDPDELMLYPLMVNEMGRAYIDHAAPGPVGATPLTLFKSTNLYGTVKYAKEYKGQLVASIAPNPEVGSIISIEDFPNLYFKVLCDQAIISDFTEEFGLYGEKIKVSNPDRIKPSDMSTLKTHGERHFNNQGFLIGADTFGRTKEGFKGANTMIPRANARETNVQMPGHICNTSHLYVLQILDPTKSFTIMLDGRTLLADGNTGPTISPPLDPGRMVNKGWQAEVLAS